MFQAVLQVVPGSVSLAPLLLTSLLSALAAVLTTVLAAVLTTVLATVLAAVLTSASHADTQYRAGEQQVQHAQRLNLELTPLGAERAGNHTDIPRWRGGLAMPPLGYQGPGHRRPDPFPHDVVQYRITASELDDHRTTLPMGLQALLANTDAVLQVYPSRRTAAAAESWYEQTYLNVVQRPDTLQRASGGVPFPIPDNGLQVLTNALLRWQGRHYYSFERLFHVSQAGVASWPLASQSVFPFSQPMATNQFDMQSELNRLRSDLRQADEKAVVYWHAWRERSLDRPFHRQQVFFAHAAAVNVMDIEDKPASGPGMLPPSLLLNQPGQYHWQLLGKQELLIPYNNYRLFDQQPGYGDFLKPGIPDVSRVRFERHRVWVLDGVLKGRSHASYSKQVVYVDEDSWAPVMVDRYAASGELVGVGMALLTAAYEVPAIVSEFQLEFDLRSGDYWFHALDDHISLSRDYSRLPLSRNRSLVVDTEE